MKIRNNYYCPECFGNLNISDKIILKIKSSSNDLGLIMLSTKISDYSSETTESIKKVEGEHYELYCPLCSKCLNLEPTQNKLIKLFMKDKDNMKHEVIFSGIFGENCTYIINDYKLEYFGAQAKKYIDEIAKLKEYYDKHL